MASSGQARFPLDSSRPSTGSGRTVLGTPFVVSLSDHPSPQPSPVKGEGAISLLPWREKARMRGRLLESREPCRNDGWGPRANGRSPLQARLICIVGAPLAGSPGGFPLIPTFSRQWRSGRAFVPSPSTGEGEGEGGPGRTAVRPYKRALYI